MFISLYMYIHVGVLHFLPIIIINIVIVTIIYFNSDINVVVMNNIVFFLNSNAIIFIIIVMFTSIVITIIVIIIIIIVIIIVLFSFCYCYEVMIIILVIVSIIVIISIIVISYYYKNIYRYMYVCNVCNVMKCNVMFCSVLFCSVLSVRMYMTLLDMFDLRDSYRMLQRWYILNLNDRNHQVQLRRGQATNPLSIGRFCAVAQPNRAIFESVTEFFGGTVLGRSKKTQVFGV